MLKEKQITLAVTARSEMSFATEGPTQQRMMYIAMALRSSGIEARTYLYRAPLDRIDVRTHSHSRDSWLKISK